MSDKNGNVELPELYRKHRPTMFKEVVGQDDAVSVLNKMIKSGRVSHAFLFAGPSGTGKTTMARILSAKLGCEPVQQNADFQELNAADCRGVDTIRDIGGRMRASALHRDGSRVWIIDEAQQLTRDAQNAFLKILEDPPSHAYFFLCSTEPDKLIDTVRNRCTRIELSSVQDDTLRDLLISVLEKEKVKVDDDWREVVDRCVRFANGSPRLALVNLHKVLPMTDQRERLGAILEPETEAKANQLAQMLLKGARWEDVAKTIKDIKEKPETLRRIILGYMATVMLGGGKISARAFLVANEFTDPWFDSDRARLAMACYAACNLK